MMTNFNKEYIATNLLDLSKISPQNGDIAYYNNKLYIFNNSYWIELTQNKILPISQSKVNCINLFQKQIICKLYLTFFQNYAIIFIENERRTNYGRECCYSRI